MRSLAIALVVLFASALTAHADEPIVVRAGLGVTFDHVVTCNGTCWPYTSGGPGLHIEIAYRARHYLAFGVHAAVARSYYTMCPGGGTVDGQECPQYDGALTSLQVGIGADWSVGRFWVTPWIGLDDRVSSDADGFKNNFDTSNSMRDIAYGLGAGADVYISQTGHRVGPYIDITRAERSSTPRAGYTDGSDLYLSAGITYRYW